MCRPAKQRKEDARRASSSCAARNGRLEMLLDRGSIVRAIAVASRPSLLLTRLEREAESSLDRRTCHTRGRSRESVVWAALAGALAWPVGRGGWRLDLTRRPSRPRLSSCFFLAVGEAMPCDAMVWVIPERKRASAAPVPAPTRPGWVQRERRG
ncbi:uncharacterized protein PFL1_01553 [Pseudozyma flocculosa PF-1]|uniref:uncharacterized protein n=1 Tax=Pseudozyma flocculosa PF-1 TaxID=1277687 RepID=UPI000456126F|nr:uncharacterized protein PFL1_01553 [Pseudozyma flocculosa PF-1]EPQ30652.1 hypothetical protein PFL1_01553 [Pseudozyma flocculosa PF-1]